MVQRTGLYYNWHTTMEHVPSVTTSSCERANYIMPTKFNISNFSEGNNNTLIFKTTPLLMFHHNVVNLPIKGTCTSCHVTSNKSYLILDPYFLIRYKIKNAIKMHSHSMYINDI